MGASCAGIPLLSLWWGAHVAADPQMGQAARLFAVSWTWEQAAYTAVELMLRGEKQVTSGCCSSAWDGLLVGLLLLGQKQAAHGSSACIVAG